MKPAVFEDRPIWSSFLRHIAAGLFDRAGGAGRHVPGFQRLDDDRAETIGERRRRLMVPILADARRLRFAGRRALSGCGVALGAALAPTRGQLRLMVLAILNEQPLNRDRRQFVRRQGEAIGDATVNPDFLDEAKRSSAFKFTGEGNVLVVRVTGTAGIAVLV